ncbi:Os01g0620900 [Oryza sativa Japonica Group]|uniref:Os01g0620900 protein n=1 Tax=Oryza sativa subsp. japonica TaxID=39947 RepID=A0A0N7KDC2_ORYSJ|nr:hypothetical protein EE612_004128 [Oryza sativa]BAS73209.1 Os01g0620900 [Oryza sativa Japonica Group]
MDGETLSWAEPECGDEFALFFLDKAACTTVSGAISTVTASRTGSPGCAWRGRRVPPPEVTSPAGLLRSA